MNTMIFQAGGALTQDHAAIYIERQADQDARNHLDKMDYLLIVAQRQRGKTSLVNFLMRHPSLSDVVFAYVDMTTPNASSEFAWYQTLCPDIWDQLKDNLKSSSHFLPRQLGKLVWSNQQPDIPENSNGWKDFLSQIAKYAGKSQRRVVIVLDEIGAMDFPGATDFFIILRAIHNSRQVQPEFNWLTFLLVGAFNPTDLIEDKHISPFNIAQRIRLPDFTLDQVYKLVNKGFWSEKQAIAKRIHYWTNGQPKLTQLLCSYLGEEVTKPCVDAAVERLLIEDENHIPPLIKRLNENEKLTEYVARIQLNPYIKFHRNQLQTELELLGIIRPDTEGYCTIRNQIYRLALDKYSHFLEESMFFGKEKKQKEAVTDYRGFLSKPENRAAVHNIGQELLAEVAPEEAEVTTSFIEPLIEMTARGETITADSLDESGGFGGADLMVVVAVQVAIAVLHKLLTRSDEASVEEFKRRLQSEENPKTLIKIEADDVKIAILNTNSSQGKKNSRQIIKAVNLILSAYLLENVKPYAEETPKIISTSLLHNDKQRLIAELNKLPQWKTGGVDGERAVLLAAGLPESMVFAFNLTGVPATDAINVITLVEDFGELESRATYTALGALAAHLLNNSPDKEGRSFLAGLIVAYRMIDDDDYLAELRRQYLLSH